VCVFCCRPSQGNRSWPIACALLGKYPPTVAPGRRALATRRGAADSCRCGSMVENGHVKAEDAQIELLHLKAQLRNVDEKRDDKLKRKPPGKQLTTSALEQNIRAKESEMQHSSLTIQQEKVYLKQIKLMKDEKKALDLWEKEMEDLRTRRSQIQEQMRQVSERQDAARTVQLLDEAAQLLQLPLESVVEGQGVWGRGLVQGACPLHRGELGRAIRRCPARWRRTRAAWRRAATGPSQSRAEGWAECRPSSGCPPRQTFCRSTWRAAKQWRWQRWTPQALVWCSSRCTGGAARAKRPAG